MYYNIFITSNPLFIFANYCIPIANRCLQFAFPYPPFQDCLAVSLGPFFLRFTNSSLVLLIDFIFSCSVLKLCDPPLSVVKKKERIDARHSKGPAILIWLSSVPGWQIHFWCPWHHTYFNGVYHFCRPVFWFRLLASFFSSVNNSNFNIMYVIPTI